MSKEIALVEGCGSTNDPEVLESLKSRYLFIPYPSSSDEDDADDADNNYFTSLSIFGNRDVDGPESPLPPSFSNLMVDPNIIDPHMIKEKIISALKILKFRDQRVLVQFWSPVVVRNRWLLTTWDQPFGLGVVDKGLYSHRLKSELHAIVIDGEHREELAPPGRVFSKKLPEWCLDVHSGDTCSDVYGYIDLPVFESGGDLCVGIIEIITSSSNYVDYAFEVQNVSSALEKQRLKSPNALVHPRYYVVEDSRKHELDGIHNLLKSVCVDHNLPLAQTWAVSECSSYVSNSGNIEQSCSTFSRSCIGKVCMSTTELPFYVQDLSKWEFREACKDHHLEKSRGVVGKSLASRRASFCVNVTELEEHDYPLAPLAHMCGLTSCLAIYLKSIDFDVEYVLEFFLDPSNTNEEGLQGLMETIKQQIQSTFGIKLDITLTSFPEVIGEFTLNWNVDSQRFPVTFLTEKGEAPLPESENAKQIGTHLQIGVPLLEKGVEDSDLNSGTIKRKNNANFKGVRRKRKSAESSFSYEEIEKHFGKTMDAAAADLKISRSTLKRVCRELGIPRWPYKIGPDKNNIQSDSITNGDGRTITPVFEASSEKQLGTTNKATETGNHSFTVVSNMSKQSCRMDVQSPNYKSDGSIS
ncbi:protein NLP6-like [Rutidosis leptorrhynchoides]|uniref:protein NLP6-like n=1 Tax=Rutidosis leptorrhynchoides TaxID=125765 RepID=UPI003A9910C7